MIPLNNQTMPGRSSRRWRTTITVYDHLGTLLEVVPLARAQYLFSTDEYWPTGSTRVVDSLVHKGPPDAREQADEMAMKCRGSRKAHFRERFHSGVQRWALKHQNTPWGGLEA